MIVHVGCLFVGCVAHNTICDCCVHLLVVWVCLCVHGLLVGVQCLFCCMV